MLTAIRNKLSKLYSKIREPFRQLARIEHKGIVLQRVLDEHRHINQIIMTKLDALASDLGSGLARINALYASLQGIEETGKSNHREVAQLRRLLVQNSRSIRWLAEQVSSTSFPVPESKLLVSIIMPTWNRGDVIEKAIQSLLDQTYPHWECIIVDDGSTDGTPEKLKRYFNNPRFRYFYQEHRNGSAARNLGLSQARGEIVAYLDTDNVWFAHYLAIVVSAFSSDDTLQSVYTAQIIFDQESLFAYIRCEPFDREALHDALRREGYIDMNVFAHRRQLFQRYGGFDERLDRFEDWDLILRYTEHEKTKCLPALGGIYNIGLPDQVSRINNYAYNRYLIESKKHRPVRPPLKVLYVLWHYPQLSESYVRTEIIGVRKLGVEVEVWAEENSSAQFESEVPIHRGSLREAIDRVKPDLIHTHWLNMAERYAPDLKESSLPLTVRGHGFEFSVELVDRLNQNSRIESVYLFPHFADQYSSANGKIKRLPVTFNPDLYYPSQEKDRKLVLRVGCALPSKDYKGFMETARLCPQYRFVLVLCRAHRFEFYADEFIELNKKLGHPVDLRINMQHEDLADLVRQAGIYMHTAYVNGSEATPIGMPISIAEAMAAGCYILGRRCSALAYYIQNAGKLYDTPEEAVALIREVENWRDREWQEAARHSIDRAYGNFVDVHVLEALVNDWRKIVRKN